MDKFLNKKETKEFIEELVNDIQVSENQFNVKNDISKNGVDFSDVKNDISKNGVDFSDVKNDISKNGVDNQKVGMVDVHQSLNEYGIPSQLMIVKRGRRARH